MPGPVFPATGGSTIEAGMARMPAKTRNMHAATIASRSGTRCALAAAATRNEHATAPTLQQKFTTLSFALRWLGFTSATSRFVAGTASPRPAPYIAMHAIPSISEPDSNSARPAVMNRRPDFIANRYPQRETSQPEIATAVVEAKYCAL